MSTIRITRAQLVKGIELDANIFHRIQLVPDVECVRLLGLFFDTNKTFILPATLELLKLVPKQYKRHPNGEVVIFGHTDTTGEPSVNDPLSTKRAEMMAAYLKDDVDAWLKNYESTVAENQRWGAHEDFLMVTQMQGFDQRDPSITPITWFQQTRELKVDGIAGPETRRQLVTEYMAVDGTTLPASSSVTSIGCGEDFPLDETGRGIDSNPEQNKSDSLDRRVELFFLNPAVESPPAKARDAYPEWLARSTAIEIGNGGTQVRVLRLCLLLGGKAISKQEYLVSSPKAVIAGGILTEDGRLEAVIPKGIGAITVDIPESNFRQSFTVQIDAFPNASIVRGAQLRLANLGYYNSPIDDDPSEQFGDAVAAFRLDNGLPEGRALDTDVATKLVEVYGS